VLANANAPQNFGLLRLVPGYAPNTLKHYRGKLVQNPQFLFPLIARFLTLLIQIFDNCYYKSRLENSLSILYIYSDRIIIARNFMDLKTKLIFWRIWVATLLFFGGFYTLTAYFPLYLADANIPDWQIGFVSGFFGVSALLSRPFIGLLCDKISTHRVIIGSVICFMVGTLPLSLSSNLVFLLLLRIFQALGYVGFTTAATTSIVKLLALPLRDRWVAWYGAAANVAVTFTPLALDMSKAGNSFYLAALFAGLGLVTILWAKNFESKPTGTTISLNIYQTLKFVRLPVTFAFIAGTNFGAFLQFTPLLAKEGQNISTGFIYTCYGLSIILVRIIIWKTLNTTLQNLVLPLGFGLMGLGLAIFAVSPVYEFYLLGAAIIAFGSGMQSHVLIGLHINALPASMQGRAVALYYFGFDAGIGLGSWLLTPLLAVYGLRGLFGGAATAALIGLIIWLRFRKRIGVKNAD
jgi:MFS family permease